jgi:hypothetical protein
MGIFDSILSTLGFGSDKQAKTTEAAASPAPAVTAAGTTVPAPQSISEVDVVTKLTILAGAHAEKLNWQNSIVDLLKLLCLDSSLNARKELARELACPAEKLNDSAQMNVWLHQAVLQKLAQNGGNIPPELLH